MTPKIGPQVCTLRKIRHENDNTGFYSYQVYALAKTLQIKPSQLFDYFHGDGERPIIGIT